MELSVEKDREKEKKERKEKGGGQVVKTKEYYPPLSLVQTKEGPRALVCLYNISKKRLYSEREKDGVGVGEMSIPGKETERKAKRERAKEKGTGDPFRFYTTVNSNCTRWLMAFPFSPLFAKIPSYTSLISHSHANEDRSCNDILRWETPARDGLGCWWWLGGGEGEEGVGRVAYNRFFFLEMSRKMRVPCDSGVKRVRIKKLNAIFGWIFAENERKGWLRFVS